MAEQLNSLRHYLANADASSARRVAHTIKGSAANISAVSLQDVALQAEKAAASGELAHAADLVHTLEEEFEKFKAAAIPNLG